VGIIHKSISQENLTLDGRFLDTDSIEYEETTRACPYYIKLGFQVENTEILKEATPLKDVLRPGDKTNFYRTWLHDLMLASELTANAFQILSGQQYDWKKYCLDACQKYLNEDYKKWIPLLRYKSYARKFLFSSEFPIESIEWSLELDELCENSTCTGSFYDLHTHLQLNSFTTTPDRMRKNSMLTLMKYDLAFWNKPLSWDNAFANWKLINFQRLKNHE